MGVRDWSTTADDNGSSDPTINWAEGQMPSSVNNSARAMMAALASYLSDAGGVLISAGTSNAFTLTTSMGVAALGAPLTLMFEADRNNTGAATLAVDGLAAKPMVNQTGGALSSGDIVDGGLYFAIYNPAADKFVLMNVTAAVAAYLSQAAEVTVASATTANILGAASSFIAISGTTTITSFGTGASRLRFVRATGAFLITHNATSLICPTGGNITTAAGDTFLVVSDASSNARIYAYQRATGAPLVLADASVTTAKIADANVTTAKVADNNITTAKIADDNVTFVKIAAAAIASQAEAEAGAATNKLMTPQRVAQAIAATSPAVDAKTLARAWVNFNGTGTVAIRSSYNVSSITDNGTGDYTVNFTSALPNANYAAIATGGSLSGGAVARNMMISATEATGPNLKSTTQLRVLNGNTSTGGLTDGAECNVLCFGG